MSLNNENNNADNKDWQEIQDLFNSEQAFDNSQFKERLSGFREDLKSHPYVLDKINKRTNTGSFDWFVLLRRTLIPATTGIVVVLIIFTVFFSNPKLSWAQVVRQFQEIDFFSASIYMKDDGLSQPEQIELWMGRGCKVRVRIGNQLIFAEKAEVIAAFDLKTRKQTEPDRMGARMIQLLGKDETFSMNTVLRGLSGGKLSDKTPVLNSRAIIAEDLAVFDLESEDDSNPQWFRIWTLKKSGLPVRIRMWDPRDAATVDMLIDYSKPQPDVFFDPKAYASTLSSVRTDKFNLAYLHLKDHGDKSYVPGITDETKAMSIVTTTIDGEQVRLSHYSDKNIVLMFWDRYYSGLDFEWLKKLETKYAPDGKLQIITVALQKNASNVRELMESRGINFTVWHEPGKGFRNSLARAIGVKHGSEIWLIRRGKAIRIYRSSEKVIDLVCNGLKFENEVSLSRFIKMQENSREYLADLCGKAHKTEIVDGRELWYYMFTSADEAHKGTVTFRFNEEGKLSGRAWSSRLIEPSRVQITLSRELWDEKVVAGFGKENVPPENKDHHIEIYITRGKNKGGYIIGGGHPRTEIEPKIEYNREVKKGSYGISVRLMDHKDNSYSEIEQIELLEKFEVGKNENVVIHFDDTGEAEISKSEYIAPKMNNTERTRKAMLKKTDLRKMYEEARQNPDKYDDPKYIPWKMHLKEIAKRYEGRPLPEKMELFEKNTDEKYAFKMMPKNLPGHDGYSARAIEGDLKGKLIGHPLGPGLMRWPEDVASIEMNHDLVLKDDIPYKEQWEFVLKHMGYELETKKEDRKVIVAKYDGRELPDPDKVSVQNPIGAGYFTAEQTLNYMTRALDNEITARGPLFIDETNLPAKADTPQGYKEIAISMELPNVDSFEDFENLKPWFNDNFGITFEEETRPIEILVVKSAPLANKTQN